MEYLAGLYTLLLVVICLELAVVLWRTGKKQGGAPDQSRDWTFIGTLPGFPIVTSRIRLLQVIMIVITMTMTGWPLISVITMNGLVTRFIIFSLYYK